MGSRKPVGPTGLLAYFVEVEERDGEAKVDPEVCCLVRKCIEDKLFSENRDHIAICRSDTTSEIRFANADWNALRKGLNVLQETAISKSGCVGNPIDCIDDIATAVAAKSKEDAYEEKKILFFATLSSYVINEEETRKLAEKLLRKDVYISIVLPDREAMSEIQYQNSKILKTVFREDKFDDICSVTNFKKAKSQIYNTISKKPSRPSPWNAAMEITPEIIINVGGYVCTRKNKPGEMARVLLKQTDMANISEPSSSRAKPSSGAPEATSDTEGENPQKTVVVEVAKEVLEKEKIWTEKDGTTPVAKEDVGTGYYFGDKIIPYNELENEDGYHSGEKCLKVLVFCPPENISPALHAGDGTTLFYPKKDDEKSEVMFLALFRAMESTNRVAVVRKVYRKGTKVTIGTLVPDASRQCLVFTEICFADDISVPHLPLLVKPEEMGDEEENEGLTKKEELIDKLIALRTIENFTPLDGPTDPAVSVLRSSASKKILKEQKDLDAEPKDNIDMFFENLVVNEDTLAEMQSSFPLKVNKVENERFAGQNIFRKRKTDEEDEEVEMEKKPKLEINDDENANVEADENDKDEINDLLDEL